jgi:hypothetical protein
MSFGSNVFRTLCRNNIPGVDPQKTTNGGSVRIKNLIRSRAILPEMRSFPIVMSTLLWSAALAASSFFLKGLAIGDWVDATLYLGAGVWLTVYMSGRRVRCA